MDIFLNELSVVTATSEAVAYNWTLNLIKCLKEYNTFFPSYHVLSIYNSIDEIHFGDNIPFNIVLNRLQNEDRSIIIRKITDKPIIRNLPDYYFQNKRCTGLAAAFEAQSIGVSFQSNNLFDNWLLNLEEYDAINNINDTVVRRVEVRHIYSDSHIENHRHYIINKINDINRFKYIHGHKIFWEQKGELFSKLIFSDNVFTNLSIYKNDSNFFQNILEKLNQLNSCFSLVISINYNILRNWVSGNPRQYDINDKYLFKFPNNISHYCLDHINFFLGSTTHAPTGRILYYPDYENKICYIGYIGKHP